MIRNKIVRILDLIIISSIVIICSIFSTVVIINHNERLNNTDIRTFEEPKFEPEELTPIVYKTAMPIVQASTPETIIVYETVYEPIYETIIFYPEDYEALREKADLLDAIYEDRVDYERYLYEKFPEAFTVWSYLTGEMGLNNYVAAGIIGNMMNECGGNSLKLQPLITSSHSMTYKGVSYHFYGICQWFIGYNPQMAGASLEKQLEYLNSNIESIFDNYGYLYKKGFKYADFCALTDCKEAATAFMVVYERPGPSTKTTRQNNACYAYSVFVSN